MSNLSYKITETQVGLHTVSTVIATTSEGKLLHIPLDNGNMDYQQFLQDIKEHGYSIVEGPDIVTPDYKQQRLTEYPSLADQQDMQYWDAVNGTTTWKDKINEIKTKYPKTNTGSTTVGDVPSWVQSEVDKLNS